MKILWRFFFLTRADWPWGIGVIPLDYGHGRVFLLYGRTIASENFLQKFGFSQGGGLFFQWFHPWPKIFPCKTIKK
jgi:hypothetical protein